MRYCPGAGLIRRRVKTDQLEDGAVKTTIHTLLGVGDTVFDFAAGLSVSSGYFGKTATR